MKACRKGFSVLLIMALCFTMVFMDYGVASAETENISFDGYTPISTKEELNQIRNDLDGKYYLTCDIVFTEEDFKEGGDFYNGGKGWMPIGTTYFGGGGMEEPFTGILDGNGYGIYNLKSQFEVFSYAVGLFNTNSGEIRNLFLENSEFLIRKTGFRVGGIAGINEKGKILNCSNEGTLTGKYVGGIVGQNNEGEIINCTSKGVIEGDYAGGIVSDNYRNKNATLIDSNITKVVNCNNFAKVSGVSYGGGICGTNLQSSIEDCHNYGDVSSDIVGGITAWNHTFGKIVRSHNDGKIEGAKAGGIAGYNYYQGTIRYSYNVGGVKGTKETGGIVGENWNYSAETISDCYNSGVVELLSEQSDYGVGGIVGENNNYGSGDKALVRCYNVGDVIKTLKYGYVGSLIGENKGTIKNSYYLKSSNQGIGKDYNSEGNSFSELSATQMQDESNFATYDFEQVWKIDAIDCYHYPRLLNNWMEQEHFYGEWTVTKEPTCTEKGLKERTCTLCKTAKEVEDIAMNPTAHSFTNYTYNNDATVGKDGTETAVCDNGCGATDTRTKAGTALSGGGSSGGGIDTPSVQKPEISSGDGYTTELSDDGKTAEIMIDEDYELVDVSVNGISKGNTTTLEGLKTGDKVVITVISKVEKIQNQLKTVTKENLQAHSKQVKLKNGKKAVKIIWTNTSGIDFDGVEIFRSFKRYEGFGTKPIFTTEKEQYYNTAVKKGKRYYYKVRGYIEYDGVKYYSGWSAKAWRTVK